MSERQVPVEDGRYWQKRERAAELMRQWDREDTTDAEDAA